MIDVEIASGGSWPAAVDRLLRGLPLWFGLPESNANYVREAESLPTTVARVDGEIVGACLVRVHNPLAAEIELIAVRGDLHRSGIGRRLLAHVESGLRADGVRVLQVKTFGPSGESPEYARTRAPSTRASGSSRSKSATTSGARTTRASSS